MDLGYAPLMYAPTELPDAFEEISECGYDSVDLVLGKLRTAGFETVRSALEATGLSVDCVVAGWLDSRDAAASVVDAVPAIARLDADAVGLIPPQHGVADSVSFDEWLSTVEDSCSEYGLTPLVHHHAGAIVDTPRAIETFLQGHDVDLLFDTAHYHLYDACESGVRRFADRIAHVHLKDVAPTVPAVYFRSCVEDLAESHPSLDSVATVYRSFTDLGAGEIDLQAVAGAMSTVEYNATVTVEVEDGCRSPAEHVRSNAAVARRAFRQ
jgi:sugar phosphate isomerase/epimerase